jgi:monovalent cation/hydrogen antiporter
LHSNLPPSSGPPPPDLDTVPPVIADRVRQSLRARVDLAREASAATHPLDAGYRNLRRAVVLVQRAELERLHAIGSASEPTRRRIQRQLDLKDARCSDEA